MPSLLLAKPVTISVAQQVADNYINAPLKDASGVLRAPQKKRKMTKMAKQVTDNQQFYVFNNENGEGFVIISADDVARPVLGYSQTGSFDADNIPDNLRWWLSEYDRQIQWAQENNLPPSEEIAEQWKRIKANQVTAATPVVGPLIQTHWGQAPYYNNKCPKSDDGDAVTGCTATALAQIMRYWSWPEKGFGSHEYTHNKYGELYANFGETFYDWDNMPNWLDEISSSKEIDAVSTLMYHCGVSVDMNYGPDVSSAYNNNAANAACNYFYYSDAIEYLWKNYFSSNNLWYDILFDQLNNRFPILYGGAKSDRTGGHAFVCDGYNSAYYLHFNWGW